MNLLKTTKQHSKYWVQRKIDWNQAYLSTWDHPHREVIISVLKTFDWRSLWEVGCASGPNLVKIAKNFPNRQLGGNDINADAIALAKQTFRGGIFEVSPADSIMMSDGACDVILTDMTLIYVGPRKIKKVLKEFHRMCRSRVILVEFDSKKWWRRLWLRYKSGYNGYDYEKLLKEAGFWDVMKFKIPNELYPGASKIHGEFATILSAKK